VNGADAAGARRMSLRSELCFRLARRKVLARSVGSAGENPATFDRSAYQAWRSSELRNQFCRDFATGDLAGRDVLDFGCGAGELSFFVAGLAPRSIIGVDLSEELVRSARARAESETHPVQPQFSCATDSRKIDLPANSVDVVLCFDVLEHVMDYESIIGEWKRILRPQGKVLIWWTPWLHPYGPHIESLVPLPWAHVFFSDRALIETCARIYDLPDFKPRLWDLDAAGKRKPNKWRQLDTLPGVNRLTISRFERLCAVSGLRVARRRINGFGGSSLARLTHVFTALPLLREFFASSIAYELSGGEE
jgi:SAM-dependent methyltransferase